MGQRRAQPIKRSLRRLSLLLLGGVLLLGEVTGCNDQSIHVPYCVVGLGNGCTGGSTSGSVGGPLSFTPSESFFITNTPYVLVVTGGTPPYTFSIASATPLNAQGTFNPTVTYASTTYTAPTIPSSVTIQIQDSSASAQVATKQFNVCYAVGNTGCP